MSVTVEQTYQEENETMTLRFWNTLLSLFAGRAMSVGGIAFYSCLRSCLFWTLKKATI